MFRGSAPLDSLYFDWIWGSFDKRWDLSFDEDTFRIMFQTPFMGFVPNDQNRAKDGVELREQFLHEIRPRSSVWEIDGWLALECSVLEMLVALAARAEYLSENAAADWMAEFIRNLGLDPVMHRYNPGKTRRVLRRLNERTYEANGAGGLFPLRHPLEDQRGVEVWYQLNAYIIEGTDDREAWGEGV